MEKNRVVIVISSDEYQDQLSTAYALCGGVFMWSYQPPSHNMEFSIKESSTVRAVMTPRLPKDLTDLGLLREQILYRIVEGARFASADYVDAIVVIQRLHFYQISKALVEFDDMVNYLCRFPKPKGDKRIHDDKIIYYENVKNFSCLKSKRTQLDRFSPRMGLYAVELVTEVKTVEWDKVETMMKNTCFQVTRHMAEPNQLADAANNLAATRPEKLVLVILGESSSFPPNPNQPSQDNILQVSQKGTYSDAQLSGKDMVKRVYEIAELCFDHIEQRTTITIPKSLDDRIGGDVPELIYRSQQHEAVMLDTMALYPLVKTLFEQVDDALILKVGYVLSRWTHPRKEKLRALATNQLDKGQVALVAKKFLDSIKEIVCENDLASFDKHLSLLNSKGLAMTPLLRRSHDIKIEKGALRDHIFTIAQKLFKLYVSWNGTTNCEHEKMFKLTSKAARQDAYVRYLESIE